MVVLVVVVVVLVVVVVVVVVVLVVVVVVEAWRQAQGEDKAEGFKAWSRCCLRSDKLRQAWL